VTIGAHALRKFWGPVRTACVGGGGGDVAQAAGVFAGDICIARDCGEVQGAAGEGLGGKWGHPVPLIHSWADASIVGRVVFCAAGCCCGVRCGSFWRR